MPYSSTLNRWINRNTTALKAAGAETASSSGAWLDVGDIDAAEFDVVATTVTGTTPTLLVDIYGSPTGTTRTVTDGVTNTDTSLVSATAAFVAGDVGANVWGAGIPANTHIISVTNATTVVLSAATTATATAVTVIISQSFKIATIGSNGFAMGIGTDPTNITVAGTYRAGIPTGARYLQYRSRIGGTTPSFTYSVSMDAS
jgi:hypothetical protein